MVGRAREGALGDEAKADGMNEGKGARGWKRGGGGAGAGEGHGGEPASDVRAAHERRRGTPGRTTNNPELPMRSSKAWGQTPRTTTHQVAATSWFGYASGYIFPRWGNIVFVCGEPAQPNMFQNLSLATLLGRRKRLSWASFSLIANGCPVKPGVRPHREEPRLYAKEDVGPRRAQENGAAAILQCKRQEKTTMVRWRHVCACCKPISSSAVVSPGRNRSANVRAAKHAR